MAGDSVVTAFQTGGMAVRTEQRIGRMLTYVRLATSLFAYIPLFAWHSLTNPTLAICIAVAASVEAVWFALRVRRTGTLRDRVLVTTDVLFCLALILVGTQSVLPHLHNVVATELIPTVLACSAIVGFAFEFGSRQIMAVLALQLGWVFAVLPAISLKLPSDLLGFALWYVVAALSMREFRALSRLTDQAQAAAAESQRQAARSAVEAAEARQRERVHHEVHGHLLPIVERLLAGEAVGDRLLRDARRAATRARRLISDPRAMTEDADDTEDFTTRIQRTCDTYAARVILEPVLVITVNPPEELAEALCAAVAEALRNADRHAGARCRVNLYVESTATRGEITVRDHGSGFDPAEVSAGGGFTGTFAAPRRYGADLTVDSAQGQGTTVTIRWAPADAGPVADGWAGEGHAG